MKGTVVVLPSLDEQIAAGDRDLIDPAGVGTLTRRDGRGVGVYAGDAMTKLGTVTDIRVQDGRLVADVDLPGFEFGIGGLVEELDRAKAPGHVVATGLSLVCVTFSPRPAVRA